MYKRTQTKSIKIKDVVIGHSNQVIIQSMTNTKTSNINATIKQVNKLVSLGCKLVRVAIFDTNDLKGLKKIVNSVTCPIIADIHYNYQFAINAIINGAAAIRINPGNLQDLNQFLEIIKVAKECKTPIRIGLNTGSLPKDVKTNIQIINLMKKYVAFCEDNNFNLLVLSIKSTDVQKTIELNELLASTFSYPIHLGVTEAADLTISSIRSTIALSKLLQEGIGSTIRISISGEPYNEPIVAKILLDEIGIKQDITKIIACPTCGRCQYNFTQLYSKIKEFIDLNPNGKLTVAIMGCTVNGINEAKKADIGIFGVDKNHGILYVKNKMIGKFSINELIDKFKEEYLKLM